MFAGFHPILFSAILDTPAISQHRFLLVLECEHYLPYSLAQPHSSSPLKSSNSNNMNGRTLNISNAMTTISPRFSVGSINATRLYLASMYVCITISFWFGNRDPRIPVSTSSTTALRPVGRSGNEKVFAHCVGGMSLIELTVNNSKHILNIPDGISKNVVEFCLVLIFIVFRFTGWLLAHQFIYVVDGSTDPNGWQYSHYINSNNATSSRLNKMGADSGDNHHPYTEFQPNVSIVCNNIFGVNAILSYSGGSTP